MSGSVRALPPVSYTHLAELDVALGPVAVDVGQLRGVVLVSRVVNGVVADNEDQMCIRDSRLALSPATMKLLHRAS